ncbi:aldose 1-epimerase family protein [Amycolatopsis nigrescens]|uniref:aldose 1-epimerase family protein n=1 Tax=Amycolatopsis nigrescens TaxID=381445 RepID=UPI0003745079|nr:aldose 1-epimerase family protein [Amycolatopsis nigrescens]
MAKPTGEQFEITRGTARAVITEIGAGLRAFEVGGVPYVDAFPEDAKPPKAAGQVLLPWPNRTKNAEWVYEDEKQQLEVTEEARGNAIHGLTRHREWQLVEHAESSITFEIEVRDEPGWPVPLHATIEYALAPRELTVTHQVRNDGETEIGVGVGTHPYFRLGDVPTDELTLTLAADRVRPFEDGPQLPYADEQDVDGTEYDLREGRILGGCDFDTTFGGLAPGEDGRHHHLLSYQDKLLEVWTGPDFKWVQVFTPADLVGRGRAVAIEPMTCPADALNSGTDLIRLAPGDTWTGDWGVQVHP